MPEGGNQRHDRKTIYAGKSKLPEREKARCCSSAPALGPIKCPKFRRRFFVVCIFFLVNDHNPKRICCPRTSPGSPGTPRRHLCMYRTAYKLYGGPSGNVRNHLRCWATDGSRDARTKPIGLAAVAQPRQQRLPRLCGPTRRASHFPTHPPSLGPARFNQRRVVFEPPKRQGPQKNRSFHIVRAVGGGAAKGVHTRCLASAC